MSEGSFKQGVGLCMCAQSRFLFMMVAGSGYGWWPGLGTSIAALHWALVWLRGLRLVASNVV